MTIIGVFEKALLVVGVFVGCVAVLGIVLAMFGAFDRWNGRIILSLRDPVTGKKRTQVVREHDNTMLGACEIIERIAFPGATPDGMPEKVCITKYGDTPREYQVADVFYSPHLVEWVIEGEGILPSSAPYEKVLIVVVVPNSTTVAKFQVGWSDSVIGEVC